MLTVKKLSTPYVNPAAIPDDTRIKSLLNNDFTFSQKLAKAVN